jgi:hypothetical protein
MLLECRFEKSHPACGTGIGAHRRQKAALLAEKALQNILPMARKPLKVTRHALRGNNRLSKALPVRGYLEGAPKLKNISYNDIVYWVHG